MPIEAMNGRGLSEDSDTGSSELKLQIGQLVLVASPPMPAPAFHHHRKYFKGLRNIDFFIPPGTERSFLGLIKYCPPVGFTASS